MSGFLVTVEAVAETPEQAAQLLSELEDTASRYGELNAGVIVDHDTLERLSDSAEPLR